MIRTIWAILAAGVITGVCSLSAFAALIVGPYSAYTNGLIRFWARSILFVSGIRSEVSGKEHIEAGQSYVYISNHQGNFDILTLVMAIPGTARFVAKKELFKIPLFAQGMRAVGMIKIDRQDRREAQKTLQQSSTVVKKGVSMIFFAEGTRSRDGNILPFKKGGFVVAIEQQIPILPVVIYGSREIMKKKSLRVHKGVIHIRFLPPIETRGMNYTDREELMTGIRNQIIANFQQMQAEVNK